MRNLTKFQALYIKYLREKCEGSWRWVAAKFEQRYTDKVPFKHESTFGGNQLDGMSLCSEAMSILNEQWEGEYVDMHLPKHTCEEKCSDIYTWNFKR
jgi:hypothetical protein